MTDSAAELTFLKFALCSLTGAVPLAHAREVLPMADLIRPPRLVPTVEGLLNLGGETIPVLRLDKLLDLPEFTPGADAHLILTRATTLTCLLMVNRVLGVERVAAADVRPVPEFVTTSACVRTQYPTAAGPVHVLDLNVLLAAPARALRAVA